MSHHEAWVFFGDHGVSATPFADNLPGLQQNHCPDATWMAPEEPMLPALQVSLASVAILAVTIGTLLLNS